MSFWSGVASDKRLETHSRVLETLRRNSRPFFGAPAFSILLPLLPSLLRTSCGDPPQFTDDEKHLQLMPALYQHLTDRVILRCTWRSCVSQPQQDQSNPTPTDWVAADSRNIVSPSRKAVNRTEHITPSELHHIIRLIYQRRGIESRYDRCELFRSSSA